MKYTETHEWIETHDGIGTVGISEYAQKELGDIVYVELPEIGKKVLAGMEAAVLESTKAAADVYSPISGTIIDVNKALNNNPELVNKSPEKEGWIYKVKISNPEELDHLKDKG
jgi:glycine cleavage system H protein